MDTADTLSTDNVGWQKRQSFFANGIDCEIMGPLTEAPFQSRYYPTDMQFRLVLKRTESNFHLDAISTVKPSDPPPYKLAWKSCQLYVKRVLVNPRIMAWHHKMLASNQKFTFPTQICETRIFTATKGAQTVISEPLFRSTIPRVLVVTLLDPDRFHGDVTKAAFRFDSFTLSSIKACVDGNPIIYQNLEVSSTNKTALVAYNTIFDALDDIECGTDINRENYLKGSFFVVLDMNPIQHINRYLGTREGNVTLELRFSAPLDSSIMVMVLGFFQGQITIDSNRIASLEADQH
ncbi:hypothetical protein Fcan01_19798 [Folsomia candida]|uniref:Uncharacterized protein n=1 Tax=Folsomia candida TaxID=158441 RepID=A0A226DLW0_FOLCA|nr:hypothetical protein Fcan01_19798 [Folsomia candida]